MKMVSIHALAEGGAVFGTSGVRGTVEALTDRVCFAYSSAFLRAVEDRAAKQAHRQVAVGYDLRPSSPRMAAACLAGCEAEGVRTILCGALPTPALAHFAMSRGIPAIMVTGSHIPFDRNGIKFYTSSGEISKDDELAISSAVVPVDEAAFEEGFLRAPPPLGHVDAAARELYLERYLGFFPPEILHGHRIGVYEHSSVARDLLGEVLRRLGAEVVPLGRTDTFVPVDTEAVSEATAAEARAWTSSERLAALVSTDGDADRPLVGDEKGRLWRGDTVGMLCAMAVRARTVVTPVSSNTAVERSGRFPRVERTRIGSPYVVAAMSEAARRGEAPVVGYEANGGFLLGSTVPPPRGGLRPLAPLPTRDAFLPILAILAAAAERAVPLSHLTLDWPSRHTASDRLTDFATERSRRLLGVLAASPSELAAFLAGLGEVSEVNQVDGLRVTLASGDIVHLRPSGNAPELRCYAEAATAERANELCRLGLGRAASRGTGLGSS
jgi:phosphomannomutase